ncbi:MAG: arginase [halophilic archaeon J07HX5]|jgi:arginase (EC 3.5.3.1)|nr:MAG: arginase [halophilic archaeon J07HX5]
MDKTARIIGVPMDLGADRRGVDMGPSAVRYGGLAAGLEAVGWTCTDDGDLVVPRAEERTAAYDGDGAAKYLSAIKTTCEQLRDRVTAARREGTLPLVLGGDHSVAIGTVAGAADRQTGLLWLDAHGDYNTPTSTPSGNVHGMPLAAILGEGPFDDCSWAHTPTVDPANVALVGVRELDAVEQRRLRESEVSVYTMSDIDQRGITSVARAAVDVATDGVEQVHLSLDLDVVDPNEAPGVGTPVRGGLSYRESHAAMEVIDIEARDLVCSVELVEVNPILDQKNRTAELAAELTASALGDTVL